MSGEPDEFTETLEAQKSKLLSQFSELVDKQRYTEKELSRLRREIVQICSLLKQKSPFQRTRKGLDENSFRGQLRKIISGYPDGLRTGEVVTHVLDSGFLPLGTTPINVRVGNDLRKMAEAKQITKSGKYWFPLESDDA